MKQHSLLAAVAVPFALFAAAQIAAPLAAAEPLVLNLWPGRPPGETKELPPEGDTTGPDGRLIDGRSVIRLGNVSMPQIALYRAPADNDAQAAVIVAPGGGFHILAYDLEGTEVAQWLNSLGITAVVLKYRVPFRDPEKKWLAAVQDAQRAVSLVRGNARKWGIDPERIGIMGFSAGGAAAALTALWSDRQYEAVDEVDKLSSRPDFAALIYPGALLNDDETALRDDVKVTAEAPPMFLAHAHDDRVSPLSSALLYVALQRAGASAELHIYSKGGHGYGLRSTEQPVTTWPARMEAWLEAEGINKR